MKFIYTTDKETANTLQSIGFKKLPSDTTYFLFENNTDIDYDISKLNSIVFSNTIFL